MALHPGIAYQDEVPNSLPNAIEGLIRRLPPVVPAPARSAAMGAARVALRVIGADGVMLACESYGAYAVLLPPLLAAGLLLCLCWPRWLAGPIERCAAAAGIPLTRRPRA